MELLEKLQNLGLPKRESEIYLALLQRNKFSAGEISKITSISRNKSYEILQNLVKKGLCNESYKNGIKVFSCVKPKIVMKNMLSDLEKKKIIANELEKGLTEIFEKKGTDESPLDYIEVITDKEQIKEKTELITMNTHKELLVFTKPPYACSFEDNMKEETHSIKKKVLNRSLYEYKNLKPDEIRKLIKNIEACQYIGEEARIIDELPMKLFISDEEVTMLALNDRVSLKSTFTTIIINHPSFAKAQKEVFESYWAKGISIKDFKNEKKQY